MKRIAIICMVVVLAACSAEKGKELFETAQFEEKQNNREHARELYHEIVEKYPGTPLAKEAAQRLEVLAQKK